MRFSSFGHFAAFLSALLVASSGVAEEPELPRAAQAADLGRVEALLKQGAEVGSRLADGTTALHWAVLASNHEMVNHLLEQGADANAADRYGTTPLSLAALNGDPATTQALLEAGANPNALDAARESVLMTAARTGSLEVVDHLLEAGALVGYKEPEYGLSALLLAALENHPEVVTRLARLGGRVNDATRVGPVPPSILPCKGGCGSEGVGVNRGGVPDRGERPAQEGGMTPLLYAARDGHVELARALLAAGAELELAEANGITPLLMSLINGHVAVAELLLTRGARVNVADFYGRTPLFAAVEYRNLDMNNSSDPNPADNGVAREPFLPLIERLIAAGADVNARTREYPPSRRWLHARNDISWVDMTGQTPFVRAAFAGDLATMRLLLAHGADPFLTTFKGTSALMAAAGLNWRTGQSYIESPAAVLGAVALCLELGLDVNAVNSMGVSAIMGAANRGSNDIIELLVEHGARLDIADAQGRTPLDWAAGVFLGDVAPLQKPHTVALLESLGAPWGARP